MKKLVDNKFLLRRIEVSEEIKNVMLVIALKRVNSINGATITVIGVERVSI